MKDNCLDSFEIAQYREQIVPEYRGVPLIEALPDILSEEDALEVLPSRPAFDEIERNHPASIRIHYLSRIRDFFEAFPHHFELQEQISTMIRGGYLNRNPASSAHVKQLNDGYERVRRKDHTYIEKSLPSTAECISIIGNSGSGKTEACLKVLSLYKKVIVHPDYGIHQIVWLKIDCPSVGSLKQLCMSFFLAVDSLLKTQYCTDYASRGKTPDEMLAHMASVSNLHCIGLLVIDEIQHLMSCRESESTKMMNFFVTLSNTVNVPIVLVGTPKALPLLQNNLRQARRASGAGSYRFPRFAKDDPDWQELLKNLWKYQWVKNPGSLTEEIKDVLYDESQGILALLTSLFRLAQHRAISTSYEKLSAKLISHVAKEKMSDVQPMITALKNNDEDALFRYDDILTDFIQHTAPTAFNASTSQPSQLHIPPELANAFYLLAEDGYNAEDILGALKKAVEMVPDASSFRLSHVAYEFLTDNSLAEGKKKKQNPLKKVEPQDLEVDDLLRGYYEAEDEDIGVYEILDETGVIKHPKNDFDLYQ
ncbi:ATP-binding protein [Maridesulfovibrio sp.]|uniref:ATP-binding protein n=1 Tax=Maridesulfovibrio sp. TaxID=2795000 RepID=UPI002A187997|nr:ATP-binding protein [Maridesulfovibrio sp.]